MKSALCLFPTLLLSAPGLSGTLKLGVWQEQSQENASGDGVRARGRGTEGKARREMAG